MEAMARLGEGTVHTAWSPDGHRLVACSNRGTLQILDKGDSDASFSSSHSWTAHTGSIVKVVWAPSEYGDVVSCCTADGVISLWEEIEEGNSPCIWRLCTQLEDSSVPVLDLQFANCRSGLKLITACADGSIRIYETLDILDMKNWQLQAEFLNVTDLEEKIGRCTSSVASVSWRPAIDAIQEPFFVVGYNSTSPRFNVAKIWEFVDAHQRWDCTVELKTQDEENEPVNYVAWAPNIGRPFELIAVASGAGVSIWHVTFSPSSQEKASIKRVARLTGFEGEVSQAEWDMSGMTLATSSTDGIVRLWQANYKGEWQQRAVIGGE